MTAQCPAVCQPDECCGRCGRGTAPEASKNCSCMKPVGQCIHNYIPTKFGGQVGK